LVNLHITGLSEEEPGGLCQLTVIPYVSVHLSFFRVIGQNLLSVLQHGGRKPCNITASMPYKSYLYYHILACVCV